MSRFINNTPETVFVQGFGLVSSNNEDKPKYRVNRSELCRVSLLKIGDRVKWTAGIENVSGTIVEVVNPVVGFSLDEKFSVSWDDIYGTFRVKLDSPLSDGRTFLIVEGRFIKKEKRKPCVP